MLHHLSILVKRHRLLYIVLSAHMLDITISTFCAATRRDESRMFLDFAGFATIAFQSAFPVIDSPPRGR